MKATTEMKNSDLATPPANRLVALYGLALLRLPGAWKALGGLAMLSSAAMLVSVVVTLAAPAVAFPALLTPILLQVVWVMVLGVMMLLWRSTSAERSAA